jgi:Arc/MetJ family transcription regulator
MAKAKLEKPVHAGGVTYQQKLIRCGKPTCRKWHGPYWYAFWKHGRSTKSRYVGKALPAYVRAAVQSEQLGGDRQLGVAARAVHEEAITAAARARRREKSSAENVSRRDRADLPTTRRRTKESTVAIGGKRFRVDELDD